MEIGQNINERLTFLSTGSYDEKLLQQNLSALTELLPRAIELGIGKTFAVDFSINFIPEDFSSKPKLIDYALGTKNLALALCLIDCNLEISESLIENFKSSFLKAFSEGFFDKRNPNFIKNIKLYLEFDTAIGSHLNSSLFKIDNKRLLLTPAALSLQLDSPELLKALIFKGANIEYSGTTTLGEELPSLLAFSFNDANLENIEFLFKHGANFENAIKHFFTTSKIGLNFLETSLLPSFLNIINRPASILNSEEKEALVEIFKTTLVEFKSSLAEPKTMLDHEATLITQSILKKLIKNQLLALDLSEGSGAGAGSSLSSEIETFNPEKLFLAYDSYNFLELRSLILLANPKNSDDSKALLALLEKAYKTSSGSDFNSRFRLLITVKTALTSGHEMYFSHEEDPEFKICSLFLAMTSKNKQLFSNLIESGVNPHHISLKPTDYEMGLFARALEEDDLDYARMLYKASNYKKIIDNAEKFENVSIKLRQILSERFAEISSKSEKSKSEERELKFFDDFLGAAILTNINSAFQEHDLGKFKRALLEFPDRGLAARKEIHEFNKLEATLLTMSVLTVNLDFTKYLLQLGDDIANPRFTLEEKINMICQIENSLEDLIRSDEDGVERYFSMLLQLKEAANDLGITLINQEAEPEGSGKIHPAIFALNQPHGIDLKLLKTMVQCNLDPNKTGESNLLDSALTRNKINCAQFLFEETNIDLGQALEAIYLQPESSLMKFETLFRGIILASFNKINEEKKADSIKAIEDFFESKKEEIGETSVIGEKFLDIIKTLRTHDHRGASGSPRATTTLPLSARTATVEL